MKPIEVIHANGTFALAVPDYVDARVLAANVAETHPVPAGANFVMFSSTGDFYAKYSGAASVPAGPVIDGAASELNPTVRFFGSAVKNISLIAPDACVVTMTFFKS